MSWGASDELESRRERALEQAADRSHRDWRECGVATPYCSKCASFAFEELADGFECAGCGQYLPTED